MCWKIGNQWSLVVLISIMWWQYKWKSFFCLQKPHLFYKKWQWTHIHRSAGAYFLSNCGIFVAAVLLETLRYFRVRLWPVVGSRYLPSYRLTSPQRDGPSSNPRAHRETDAHKTTPVNNLMLSHVLLLVFFFFISLLLSFLLQGIIAHSER